MSIIYKDAQSRIFYVKERYTVDLDNWVKYTNHLGEEFTCRLAAFEERFRPVEASR